MRSRWPPSTLTNEVIGLRNRSYSPRRNLFPAFSTNSQPRHPRRPHSPRYPDHVPSCAQSASRSLNLRNPAALRRKSKSAPRTQFPRTDTHAGPRVGPRVGPKNFRPPREIEKCTKNPIPQERKLAPATARTPKLPAPRKNRKVHQEPNSQNGHARVSLRAPPGDPPPPVSPARAAQTPHLSHRRLRTQADSGGPPGPFPFPFVSVYAFG
jgi:hypothetical protein